MKVEHCIEAIGQQQVLDLLDCRPDNPAYGEMAEAYRELLPEVLGLAQGQTLFGIGTIAEADAVKEYPAGSEVIYVITTVGEKLSRLASRLFEQGDCVKGMLADAMADVCLFGMEAEWLEQIKRFCGERRLGIVKRLSAPYDLPMSVQKTAFYSLNAETELEMKLTSGYMYAPVKSTCHILLISTDETLFQAQHNCVNCPQHDCKLRRIPAVKIEIEGGGAGTISCEKDESILQACARQNRQLSAACGGNGTCGKCGIQVITGSLAVTDRDREVYTQAELEQGFRLSCRAYPQADCTIRLNDAVEADYLVVEEFGSAPGNPAQPVAAVSGDAAIWPGIAIDIGTTTIAAQLVDMLSGEVLTSSVSLNHQRVFGADVISRIDAANRGSAVTLQEQICTDLRQLVSQLLKQSGCPATAVGQVILAGNTTMGHLLMGFPCESLGTAPYTPVNIDLIETSCQELTGMTELSCRARLFPGISTFVGGDIAAGLYACGYEDSDEINLFVDLGTNGEMAIGNRRRILVTSTAAGPCFEGGNISCGTGSVAGAICHVRLDKDGHAAYETICNQPPVGICGTGVIEAVAGLLEHGLADETGLLADEYFEHGLQLTADAKGRPIILTQRDIREVQLAKSAVRAGVEVLLKRYGAAYADISNVWLAGGFGFKLNRESAVAIGLFPEALRAKIVPVGNSSLAGAAKALRDDNWIPKVRRLLAVSDEVALSADRDFNDLYMEHMLF